MSLVASVVLIALGAILVWGVTGSVGGIDAWMAGSILMGVGGLVSLVALVFWSSRGKFGRRAVDDESTIRGR